ncbi:hypothetical protein ACFT38_41165 [Streptomyces sp. NPDC056975]|uniref:hypothetical protein n=1 Tax=Streptomyces sp. NPDC056975 TaxID=3345985 RepID=UPI00363E4DA3
MAEEERNARIVEDVIRQYGSDLDLKASPEVLIDIIREFGSEVDVTTLVPPNPTSGNPTVREVMQVLLRMSRDVEAIKKHLGA